MNGHTNLHGVRSITVEEIDPLPDSGGYCRTLRIKGEDGKTFALHLFADKASALRIEPDPPKTTGEPASEGPYGVDVEALRADPMLESIRTGKA